MNEEKETLLKEWVKHKKAEDKAKAKREEVAEKIENLYPLEGEKKSKTFKEEDYKVEIKESEKVDVDQGIVQALFNTFDAEVLPFKKKYVIHHAMYKALKKVSPAFHDRCAEAVTFTPGKTSVKVIEVQK